MKRSPLVLLAIALIAAAGLALIPTDQPAVADSHGGGDGNEALVEAMETLGGTYRLVRRQMGKPDMNADTADKLAVMGAAANEAKKLLPETASTDDLKKSYRVLMNKLIIILAQAENAALEGDQAKLREYVLAANTVKGEGHEMFIPDDE